jgi:vacuolar-type H+-ATPase subunit D/Vma8
MSDTEAPAVPQKRKASDKQLENLRKGMAVLKAKREALAKEKQEVVGKIEKGELPDDTPVPKEKYKPRNTIIAKPLKVESEPEVKPVKPRKKHVSKVAQQLDAFKSEMMAMVQKPAEVKEVEKIVEKPVERIIQKERVVSGSELLNKIFNL